MNTGYMWLANPDGKSRPNDSAKEPPWPVTASDCEIIRPKSQLRKRAVGADDGVTLYFY